MAKATRRAFDIRAFHDAVLDGGRRCRWT